MSLFFILQKLLLSSSITFTMYGSTFSQLIIIFVIRYQFLFDPVCLNFYFEISFSTVNWSIDVSFILKSISVTIAFFDLSLLSRTRIDSLTSTLMLNLLPSASYAFFWASSFSSATVFWNYSVVNFFRSSFFKAYKANSETSLKT